MATILILEPDESVSTSLSEAIEQVGLRSIVQENAADVADLLSVDPPALIVLDLAIEDGRGVQLCHQIRDTSGGELLPILMLGTGEEGVKSFGDALAEGGDYYFDKPLDHKKLISKILTYVGVDREAPTVVAKPPEPESEDLADRVEQMMNLGESFGAGLLEPSSDSADAATLEAEELTQPGAGPPGADRSQRSELLAQELFDEDDVDEPSAETPLLESSPDGGQSAEGLLPPAAGEPEPEPGEGDETPGGAGFPDQLEPIDSDGTFLKAPDSEPPPADGPDDELRDYEDRLMAEAAAEVAAKPPSAAEQELAALEAGLQAPAQPADTLEVPTEAIEDALSRAEEDEEDGDAGEDEDDEDLAEFERWERDRREQLAEAEARSQRQAERERRAEAEWQRLWEVERRKQLLETEKRRAEAAEKQRRAEEEQARLWEEERQKQLAKAERKARAEAEARKRAAEKKRKEEEERKRKEEEERKRKEEEERKRKEEEERKRKEEEERKRKEEEERKRKEEEERKRKEEEERKRKEEEERKRKEEEERKRKEEEERKRKEEEERKRKEEEERKRKEEEERKRKEEEERKRKEEEERKRKEEQERKRKEEQERERREEEERQRREEEERQRREEEERLAREEQERLWEEQRREQLLLTEQRRAEAAAREREAEAERERRWEQERQQQLAEAEQKTRAEAEARRREAAREREEEEARTRDEAQARQEDDDRDLAADDLWADSWDDEEVEGDEAEQMAQAATSWMEEHDAAADGPATGAFDLPPGTDPDTRVPGTDQAGKNLVSLLEEEARLARKRADMATDPDPDEGDLIGTIPDLPPHPDGEPNSTRAQGDGSVRSRLRQAEEFDRVETEDLPKLAEPDEDEPAFAEQTDPDQAPDAERAPRRVPLRRPGLRVVRAGREREAADRSAPEASGSGDAPAAEGDDFFGSGGLPAVMPPDPEKTDLATESVPAVLWRLHAQAVSGTVTFRSAGDHKQVYFERGVPVGVRSSQTADRLEEILYHQGLIDREAYAEARVKGLERARALAAHLVERGLLRPEELFPTVRRHLEDCLLGLFEWRTGRASYEPVLAPDAEMVRLAMPVGALVVEGIRRKFLVPRMMEELGGPASLLAPIPAEDRADEAPDPRTLGLSRHETEILRLVDGLRPIEEIVFLSGHDVSTVYQVLLAAVVLGLARVAVRGLHSADADPEQARKRDVDIRRRRLEAKFEQIHNASYFDILGVTPKASPYEIRTAFERLAREFHELHYSHPALAHLATKLDVVQRTLIEARDVLSDELLREGYRSALGQDLPPTADGPS